MNRFLCVVFVFAFVSAACTVLGDDYKVLQEISVPKEFFVEPGMIVKQDGSQVVYIVSNADEGDDLFGVMVNNTPLANSMLEYAKRLQKQTGNTKIPTDAASYRCTLISNLTVSQNWLDVAYTTFIPGDTLFLLRNELSPGKYTPYPPFFGLYPSYYPCTGNTTKVAFFTREDNKIKLVFNQRRITLEEGAIPAAPAVFSKDGARVAYVSTKKFRSLFVDEKKILEDQDFIEPTFHPKGNGICYIASKGDTSVLVVDEKIQKCEFPPKHSLTFSPKGDVYAYVAKSGSGVSVVKNGSRIPKDFKSASSLAFDLTGAKLAYVANDKGLECVMIDDRKVTPDYDLITFSRDAFEANGTLVFAGYNEGKNKITVGKIEAPSNTAVSSPK